MTPSEVRTTERVCLSVVSHADGAETFGLLRSLADAGLAGLSVILTANLPEELPFDPNGLPYPVRVVWNSVPKGFGANHNAAFRQARSEYFCVCNPDVRVVPETFEPLLERLAQPEVALAAPRVLGPDGMVQDSARRDLTPGRVMTRWVGGRRHEYPPEESSPFEPDWVAGMFMMFRRDGFEAVTGFDERYHMYCEDADICRRIRRSGRRIVLVPEARVVHDARRTSHRSASFLMWHMRSLARYWLHSGARDAPGSVLRP